MLDYDDARPDGSLWRGSAGFGVFLDQGSVECGVVHGWGCSGLRVMLAWGGLG